MKDPSSFGPKTDVHAHPRSSDEPIDGLASFQFLTSRGGACARFGCLPANLLPAAGVQERLNLANRIA